MMHTTPQDETACAAYTLLHPGWAKPGTVRECCLCAARIMLKPATATPRARAIMHRELARPRVLVSLDLDQVKVKTCQVLTLTRAAVLPSCCLVSCAVCPSSLCDKCVAVCFQHDVAWSWATRTILSSRLTCVCSSLARDISRDISLAISRSRSHVRALSGRLGARGGHRAGSA